MNLVNHYTAFADNNIDGEYYLPLQIYLTVEVVNEPVFGKLFMVCLTFIYGEGDFSGLKDVVKNVIKKNKILGTVFSSQSIRHDRKR